MSHTPYHNPDPQPLTLETAQEALKKAQAFRQKYPDNYRAFMDERWYRLQVQQLSEQQNTPQP